MTFAQNEKNILSHYLFPEFIQGQVRLKSGTITESRLNYNALTEEMIFENNGKHLAIAKPESIDTIYIQGKKFIPEGKVFYEIFTNLPVPLAIHHQCSVTPPGNPSGFGGTSQTTSISTSSRLFLSGGIYELKLPDDYIIEPYDEFLIKKDNIYFKANNIKQVIKCFPDKSDAIKDFVKLNKTDFKKTDDVKELIIFCNK